MPSARTRTNRSSLLLPGLAFLVAAIVAVAVFTGGDDPLLVDTDAVANQSTPSEPDTEEAEAPSAELVRPLQLPAEAPIAIGDPDAPMVMVAFESFGCLWCGHMHTRTMPTVLDDYVDEGLLRIEPRMLPYEPAAAPGARIGAAAGLQGRYWQLAEHLYPFIAGNGEPPTGRELTDQEMGAYRQRQAEDALLEQVLLVADDIDLDWDRFLADYDSQEVEDLVARDALLARQLGFTGTPAMVINGVPVGGYRSEATFTELLDRILDASTADS